jgi:predicted dehydrogenase
MTYLPVKLTAFCDIDEQRLQRTADQYGVADRYADAQQLFEQADVDAVVLCVSPNLHPDLAIAAMKAGKHVWLEKPPSLDVAGVDRMIAARGDRIAMVGFKKAFMPVIEKTCEVLQSGQAGRLHSMLGEYPMTIPTDGEAVLAEQRMTNWLANGVHPLSAMLQVGGSVAAVTTHLNADGAGCCVIEFDSGAIGNLHLCAGMKGVHERYEFFAEHLHITTENNLKLTIHKGASGGDLASFLSPGLEGASTSWDVGNAFVRDDNPMVMTQGFYAELAEFCQCVLQDRAPTRGTLSFARRVMQVYEAALRSAGRRIEIED